VEWNLKVITELKVEIPQIYGNYTRHSKTKWDKDEITWEIRKYFERNENENTTYQHLWDRAKIVLRGKIIYVHSYI